MNEVIEKQDEVPSGKEADIASRMEALLSQLADMTEQRNALQAEINQERISKQLVEAANELSIPLHIIQHDIQKVIAS